jgi:hypothetical protein
MTEERWNLWDEPLRLSFDTHGYSFRKANRGVITTPAEASLVLVATKDEEQVAIRTVADLQGKVTIETPEQALELVRLFTGADTHYLFRDSRHVEPRPATHVPGLAEYSPDYARRVSLQPPRVRKEGDDFVIERYLLDRHRKLYRVTERVGSKGSYALESMQIVDEQSPIVYPVYE